MPSSCPWETITRCTGYTTGTICYLDVFLFEWHFFSSIPIIFTCWHPLSCQAQLNSMTDRGGSHWSGGYPCQANLPSLAGVLSALWSQSACHWWDTAIYTFWDICSLTDAHLDLRYFIKVQRCSLKRTLDCVVDAAHHYESKQGLCGTCYVRHL